MEDLDTLFALAESRLLIRDIRTWQEQMPLFVQLLHTLSLRKVPILPGTGQAGFWLQFRRLLSLPSFPKNEKRLAQFVRLNETSLQISKVAGTGTGTA